MVFNHEKLPDHDFPHVGVLTYYIGGLTDFGLLTNIC